jgi:hypothetical protein
MTILEEVERWLVRSHDGELVADLHPMLSNREPFNTWIVTASFDLYEHSTLAHRNAVIEAIQQDHTLPTRTLAPAWYFGNVSGEVR